MLADVNGTAYGVNTVVWDPAAAAILCVVPVLILFVFLFHYFYLRLAVRVIFK